MEEITFKKLDNRLDMISRQWEILKQLDIEPKYIKLKELQEEINKTYKVSEKTIKRDLSVLKNYFDIVHKKNKIAFTKDGKKPFLLSNNSFVFDISKKIIENVIPESAVSTISPYFNSRENIANNSENLNQLSKKIEVIYNSPLQAPKISENILKCIYDCVLEEYKVEIKYFKDGWKNSKTYILNSLGIVIKDQIIYFVCNEDYKEYNMYLPIHRIKEAKKLNKKSRIPINFNLKEYAEKNIQRWEINEESGLIYFKAEFNKDIAFIIKETPISKDQKIIKKENGNIVVEAKIPDSLQLRAFLLSLGSQVKIIKPKVLRDFFKETAIKLLNLYRI